MTLVARRLRSRRLGLLGLLLLVLLVMLVAHTLVMGIGHADEMACGSCVVAIITGLLAVGALAAMRSAPLSLGASPVTASAGPRAAPPGHRPRGLRTVVLRR